MIWRSFYLYMAVIICSLVTGNVVAAGSKIYQWVDKDGQTHFSDAPQGKVTGVKTTDDDPTTIDTPNSNAKPSKVPKSHVTEPAKE